MADPYIDRLVARGLISDTALARLMGQNQALMPVIAPVSPPFEQRAQASAAPSENVEDRRGDPKDPYTSMLAGNQWIGQIYRHFWPQLRSLDIPSPQPTYHQRQPGRLHEQAGSYDVNRK